MWLGDCPQCDHSRCIDCIVEIRNLTDAKQDEKHQKKIEILALLHGLGGNRAGSSSAEEQGKYE